MEVTPQSSSIATRSLRLAGGIALLYALLGIAWILSSDALVLSMSTDVGGQTMAQRYKGIFYVVFTALALMWLVHVGYQRLLRADAQARSRELQAHDLFIRHPQPMWLYDRKSLALLQVNHAAAHHYGYSEREFLQMKLQELCVPEDAGRLQQLIEMPEHGYGDVERMRLRRKSGEALFVHIIAHALPYAGRDAVMVQAIDITREVLASNALERQEAQFRQLHQSLGEVLWLTGTDMREVLYVSPAFEQLYGRSIAEFRANPNIWIEAVHPHDRALAANSSAELLKAGQASCEYRIRRPDGSERWIADRKKLIVDEHGLVSMIGGIAEDITAIHERNEARNVTQVALERMVAQRTGELERANVELEAFSHTAAHDLKSPLANIDGFCQLLQLRFGDKLGTDGQSMLAHITQSARHMIGLVDDLLALSRVKSVELQPTDVDLVALAQRIISELQRGEPQRQVVFDAPAQLLVRCDRGLAASLLANLLGNAFKFTGKRARASITLRATGDVPVVSIEDNGAGFDASRTERPFKPFQRFHPATEFGGTGIGLVTCQRIVQRHGGDIWIDSAPDAGTTVHFTLCPPRAPAGEAARDAA
jgi:PAS domain S-box-containing protein